MSDIQYGGKWMILNDDEKNEYDGQITINDIEGLIHLDIYHFDPLRKNMFANTLIPRNIQCINGILTNGARVSLIDCSVYSRKAEVYSKNIISIVASYAINGVNLNNFNESLFTKIRYRISHITDWASLNSYDSYIDPKYRYSIGYKEEDKVVLVEQKGMKIVLEPTFNVERGRDDSGRITLSKDVWVNLEYNEPKGLGESIKDVRKVINLVSLGTGSQVGVLKAEVYNSSLGRMEEKNTTIENHLEVFTNFKYKERYRRIDNYYYLFSLANFTNEGNNELLGNWFRSYDKLAPIIELYLDLFKYEMTDERAFLNLTQALETLHTRFKANSIKTYRERINKILFRCQHPGIRKQHEDYLLSKRQKETNKIFLFSRLADLFLADFEFTFKLGSYNDMYGYAKKVVDTRNYYTHYDEGKKGKIFEGNELRKAVYNLSIILIYYLLKEIGFSDEHIQKIMKKKYQSFENTFGLY